MAIKLILSLVEIIMFTVFIN